MKTTFNIPAPFLTDAYKIGHRKLYPQGISYTYGTLIPRANSYFKESDKMVVFGYELFVKKWLRDYWNETFFNIPFADIEEQYVPYMASMLGEVNADIEHLRNLHALGYLPVKVKALPEGTLVPMRVPVLTLESTNDEFAWVPNYLETLLLSETFVTSTVATTALELRKIATKWGRKTADSLDFIDYQCHDFSERGQHGNDASQISGVAHLTSFVGSDTIQAGLVASKYYNADYNAKPLIGSVIASEHAVMQSYTKEGELDAYRELIHRVPNGILSLVSDTYDYFNVLTNFMPELKDEIMARDGKLVLRPDSGDPADILTGRKNYDVDASQYFRSVNGISDYVYEFAEDFAVEMAEEACETPYCLGDSEYTVKVKARDNNVYAVDVEIEYNRIEKKYYCVDGVTVKKDSIRLVEQTPEDKGTLNLLWETFGGTINSKGYKVLDPHIGILFGEGINLQTLETILSRVEAIGFSTENVVMGVGAYVYSVSVSRDSFGQAFKTQMVTVDGEDKSIFKDPKTDSGLKKSLRGTVAVFEGEDGYYVEEDLPKGYEHKDNKLETIFEDGEIVRETDFDTIRERLKSTY